MNSLMGHFDQAGLRDGSSDAAQTREPSARESLFAIRFIAEHTSSYGRQFMACEPMFICCPARRT
jgi:hypothetical protein